MPEINLLHAVLAGSAGYAIAALWQAPFAFGGYWLRHHPTDAVALRRSSGAIAILLGITTTIAQAVLLSWLFNVLAISGHGDALLLAAVMWLPLYALPLAVSAHSRGDSAVGLLLDAGQHLVVLCAIALVLVSLAGIGTKP